MPSIAFGSILVGMGLKKLQGLWDSSKLVLWKAYAIAILPVLVLVSSVGMMGYNASYFDIGRSLDPNLSATQFYEQELPKIPDGQILLTQQGWEWTMVFLYNKEEGRNIIPACTGMLPSVVYRDMLQAQGVNVVDYPDENMSTRPTLIGESIFRLNDNVWSTISTDPATYGATVIPVKQNGSFVTEVAYDKGYYYKGKALLMMSPKSITDGTMDMQWQFKPSNPYDIMTGSIEVKQWIWIVFSNYSVLTMTMMALVGAVPCWIIYMKFIKKKKFQLFRKEVPNGKA